MASIESPDGIELRIELVDGVVSITNRAEYTVTFDAELIPEIRAVLLDLEAEHWGAK